MRWLRRAGACVLACAAATALGQAEDPLKSQACASALETLKAARGAGTPGAKVEQLRAQAALRCLGSADAPQRPSRVAQPPAVVPPPRVAPPAAAETPPAVALPPPPVAIERPAVPLVCDAGGCWSDTGTHLRQIGPGLAGPGGPCSPRGGLVYCP